MPSRQFPAERLLTNIGVHDLLVYRRTDDATKCFKFQYKKKISDGFSYYCMGCILYRASMPKAEQNGFSVGVIHVSENKEYFLENPGDLDNHFCIQSEKHTYGYDATKIDQLRKETIVNVKKNGTKPAVARQQLTDKIETAYPDNSADAMLNLPNRAALSREFRYARKNYQGEEIDPKNIPEHLQLSSVTIENRQSYVLRYYSEDDPPFVLLCDRTNLGALRKAEVWVMDGTFSYRPQGFAQTYTIHAVISDLPERLSSFLSAIAFLPDKKGTTYAELFGVIKDNILAEYGDLGPAKTVIADGEDAVHGAIKKELPHFKTHSCFFHFVKNVQDYAKTSGCSGVFDDEVSAAWINGLIGSAFLPPDQIHNVFDYLLDNAPSSVSSQFVGYFRTYWRPRLEKLCAWESNVPRTTNVAEGYHNAMQTHFGHEKHPLFGKEYVEHKNDLAENAYQFIRLEKKTDEIRLREPKYRNLDKKIEKAKAYLLEYLALNEIPKMEHLTMYCRHLRWLTNSNPKRTSNADSILCFDPIEDEIKAPTILPPLVPVRVRPKRNVEVLEETPIFGQDKMKLDTKKRRN